MSLSLVVLLACVEPAGNGRDGSALVGTGLDAATGPVTASVTGGAQWIISSGPAEGLLRWFTFTATRTADGTVDGQWQLVAGTAILHGSVTCLKILGDHARLGGTVDDAKFSLFMAGTDVAWEVVDGGEGVNAAVDETSNLAAFRNAPTGAAEAFCGAGTVPEIPGNPAFEISPITYGNVKIRGD